jgi:hypothetical protein
LDINAITVNNKPEYRERVLAVKNVNKFFQSYHNLILKKLKFYYNCHSPQLGTVFVAAFDNAKIRVLYPYFQIILSILPKIIYIFLFIFITY